MKRAAEIHRMLSPNGIQSDQTFSPIFPEADIVDENDNCASLVFGGDVRVGDVEPDKDSYPDMVSTSSGHYYLVSESYGYSYPCINIFRSLDGGATWNHYAYICGDIGNPIRSPAITVPVFREDFLFVVYEYADQIQVARIDLDTGEFGFSNVGYNPDGVGSPRIATDDIHYPDYYVYITYDSVVSGDPKVYTAVSPDKGVSWGSYSLIGEYFAGKPDIEYANNNVYVTWGGLMQSRGTPQSVRVGTAIYFKRSTDFGATWGSTTTLDGSFEYYDTQYPRIAAINGGDEVVVAYSRDYTTDTDVWYAYSTDDGGSWSTNHCLDCTVDISEENPDICVDVYLGDFHAVWWEGFHNNYSHAPYTNPAVWSTPVNVDNLGTVSGDWDRVTSTVSVDWTTGEAGIGWSDSRTPSESIYFDRTDWVSPPVQAEIEPVQYYYVTYDPGDYFEYLAWVVNNTDSPVSVTASIYASNVSDWRINLFGPVTFTLQPHKVLFSPFPAVIPQNAPPMTVYICAEVNGDTDCFPLVIE